MKHFDVEKYVWLDAVQIVGSKDRQAIKARKESHFAATQIPVGPHVSTVPTIVLYFIDDNSNVMEVLGTKSLEPGTMYDWRFGEIVARNVLPESRLAAVCEGKNRWVVYQQNNGKLGGAKNSGKGWTPFGRSFRGPLAGWLRYCIDIEHRRPHPFRTRERVRTGSLEQRRERAHILLYPDWTDHGRPCCAAPEHPLAHAHAGGGEI